ncbi:hypothetical protein DFJ77DRAFT_276305 [Powellomyces hirtus]|nr:hypothetical protein DFJ77DRAFT_276305 [Powellomyces hirtus]
MDKRRHPHRHASLLLLLAAFAPQLTFSASTADGPGSCQIFSSRLPVTDLLAINDVNATVQHCVDECAIVGNNRAALSAATGTNVRDIFISCACFNSATQPRSTVATPQSCTTVCQDGNLCGTVSNPNVWGVYRIVEAPTTPAAPVAPPQRNNPAAPVDAGAAANAGAAAGGKPSGALIAGIVIGILVLVGGVAAFAYIRYRRRSARQHPEEMLDQNGKRGFGGDRLEMGHVGGPAVATGEFMDSDRWTLPGDDDRTTARDPNMGSIERAVRAVVVTGGASGGAGAKISRKRSTDTNMNMSSSSNGNGRGVRKMTSMEQAVLGSAAYNNSNNANYNTRSPAVPPVPVPPPTVTVNMAILPPLPAQAFPSQEFKLTYGTQQQQQHPYMSKTSFFDGPADVNNNKGILKMPDYNDYTNNTDAAAAASSPVMMASSPRTFMAPAAPSAEPNRNSNRRTKQLSAVPILQPAPTKKLPRTPSMAPQPHHHFPPISATPAAPAALTLPTTPFPPVRGVSALPPPQPLSTSSIQAPPRRFVTPPRPDMSVVDGATLTRDTTISNNSPRVSVPVGRHSSIRSVRSSTSNSALRAKIIEEMDAAKAKPVSARMSSLPELRVVASAAAGAGELSPAAETENGGLVKSPVQQQEQQQQPKQKERTVMPEPPKDVAKPSLPSPPPSQLQQRARAPVPVAEQEVKPVAAPAPKHNLPKPVSRNIPPVFPTLVERPTERESLQKQMAALKSAASGPRMPVVANTTVPQRLPVPVPVLRRAETDSGSTSSTITVSAANLPRSPARANTTIDTPTKSSGVGGVRMSAMIDPRTIGRRPTKSVRFDVPPPREPTRRAAVVSARHSSLFNNHDTTRPASPSPLSSLRAPPTTRPLRPDSQDSVAAFTPRANSVKTQPPAWIRERASIRADGNVAAASPPTPLATSPPPSPQPTPTATPTRTMVESPRELLSTPILDATRAMDDLIREMEAMSREDGCDSIMMNSSSAPRPVDGEVHELQPSRPFKSDMRAQDIAVAEPVTMVSEKSMRQQKEETGHSASVLATEKQAGRDIPPPLTPTTPISPKQATKHASHRLTSMSDFLDGYQGPDSAVSQQHETLEFQPQQLQTRKVEQLQQQQDTPARAAEKVNVFDEQFVAAVESPEKQEQASDVTSDLDHLRDDDNDETESLFLERDAVDSEDDDMLLELPDDPMGEEMDNENSINNLSSDREVNVDGELIEDPEMPVTSERPQSMVKSPGFSSDELAFLNNLPPPPDAMDDEDEHLEEVVDDDHRELLHLDENEDVQLRDEIVDDLENTQSTTANLLSSPFITHDEDTEDVTEERPEEHVATIMSVEDELDNVSSPAAMDQNMGEQEEIPSPTDAFLQDELAVLSNLPPPPDAMSPGDGSEVQEKDDLYDDFEDDFEDLRAIIEDGNDVMSPVDGPESVASLADEEAMEGVVEDDVAVRYQALDAQETAYHHNNIVKDDEVEMLVENQTPDVTAIDDAHDHHVVGDGNRMASRLVVEKTEVTLEETEERSEDAQAPLEAGDEDHEPYAHDVDTMSAALDRDQELEEPSVISLSEDALSDDNHHHHQSTESHFSTLSHLPLPSPASSDESYSNSTTSSHLLPADTDTEDDEELDALLDSHRGDKDSTVVTDSGDDNSLFADVFAVGGFTVPGMDMDMQMQSEEMGNVSPATSVDSPNEEDEAMHFETENERDVTGDNYAFEKKGPEDEEEAKLRADEVVVEEPVEDVFVAAAAADVVEERGLLSPDRIQDQETTTEVPATSSDLDSNPVEISVPTDTTSDVTELATSIEEEQENEDQVQDQDQADEAEENQMSFMDRLTSADERAILSSLPPPPDAMSDDEDERDTVESDAEMVAVEDDDEEDAQENVQLPYVADLVPQSPAVPEPESVVDSQTELAQSPVASEPESIFGSQTGVMSREPASENEDEDADVPSVGEQELEQIKPELQMESMAEVQDESIPEVSADSDVVDASDAADPHPTSIPETPSTPIDSAPTPNHENLDDIIENIQHVLQTSTFLRTTPGLSTTPADLRATLATLQKKLGHLDVLMRSPATGERVMELAELKLQLRQEMEELGDLLEM